jgi:hypothetical protein
VLGDVAHVLRVQQGALDNAQHLSARFGQAEQALAAADEYLDAEFILQILRKRGFLEQINQLKPKENRRHCEAAGPWQSSGPPGLPRRSLLAMTI